MEIDEYSILKKKRKKNGFAATALLISIAIALLVMVGAVLVLSKVNDSDHVATYDNGNITETESESNSEVESNDELTTISEDARLSFRKLGCKQAKELFGLDITCENKVPDVKATQPMDNQELDASDEN